MGMFQSRIQPVIDSLDVRLVLDDKALLNVTEINECLAMTFLFKNAIYLEGKVFLGGWGGGEGVTLHGYIGYIQLKSYSEYHQK